MATKCVRVASRRGCVPWNTSSNSLNDSASDHVKNLTHTRHMSSTMLRDWVDVLKWCWRFVSASVLSVGVRVSAAAAEVLRSWELIWAARRRADRPAGFSVSSPRFPSAKSTAVLSRRPHSPPPPPPPSSIKSFYCMWQWQSKSKTSGNSAQSASRMLGGTKGGDVSMMPQLVFSLLLQVMVIGSHLGRKHRAPALFDVTGSFLAYLGKKKNCADSSNFIIFKGSCQYNFKYLLVVAS